MARLKSIPFALRLLACVASFVFRVVEKMSTSNFLGRDWLFCNNRAARVGNYKAEIEFSLNNDNSHKQPTT